MFATRDASTRTIHLSVDGVRTRVVEAGHGSEVVVLLHGGGLDYRACTTADDWLVTIPALATRYRVCALDLLGAGDTDSPRSPEQYTMSAVIDHAWRTIRALGLRRCVVVGHSRGGVVATSIALDHPDAVTALVLVDSNVIATDDPLVSLHHPERVYRDDPLGSAASLRRLMELNTFGPSPETEAVLARKIQWLGAPHSDRPRDEVTVRRVLDHVRQHYGPDLRRHQDSVRRRIRQRALVAPTLLVWGLRDRAAPLKVGVELYQLLAAGFADAQLHVLNRAGHWPHLERSADFDAVMGSFLSRVDP